MTLINSSAPSLREHPVRQIALPECAGPHIVAHVRILRVFDRGIDCAQRGDHFARARYGDCRAFRTMERPYRNVARRENSPCVATAAQWDRSCEEVGMSCDKVPGSITAE